MNPFNIIVRFNSSDAHYGGNVVSGARILELFGDAVTGLSAMNDEDEGLLSTWKDVHFLKSAYPGDFIKIDAIITRQTKLRRFVSVTASRFIRHTRNHNSTVEIIEPQECIANATGIIVIPFKTAHDRSKHEK